MKWIKNIRLLLIVSIISMVVSAQGQTIIDASVFELLDLNADGLETVKEKVKQEDYKKAADELLKYYRNRTHIEHPDINASDKASWLGKEIGKLDLEKANKGMEHKFFVHKGYGYLDYGKDIDWDYWPVKDNEIRWQVNRMYWWIPMGQAYWSTGNEKYAKEWVFQLRDWIKDNPKGLSKENDRFAWRPLETSRRVQDQTTLFNFFVNSEHFTPEFLVTFLLNYHEQAELVSANYTEKGNHRLFQAQRMIYGGGFFQEFKNAERWRKEGIAILNEEMKVQVLNDGFHFEISQHYHIGSIETFLKGLRMAQLWNLEHEFPSEYLATIKDMIYASLKVSFPDMSYPMFGDAWATPSEAMTKKYKEWSTIFPEDPIIKYYATGGEEGHAPDVLSTRLSETGLTAFRNGWDSQSTALIMRAGIRGGEFHTQPDNGTFELWHKGVNLMPDAGCYVYAGDKEVMNQRNWYRQSSIHQTLTLDDKDILINTKELKWHTSENLDYLVYENKSYENLSHRRSVFFVDQSFFVIIDEAIGSATGNVKVRYQIKEGDAKYNFKNNTFKSDNKSEPNVQVVASSKSEITTIPETLKVSYSYREEIPRKGVAFSIIKEDEKPISMVSVVYPEDGRGTALNVSSKITKESDAKMRIEVSVNGKTYTLGYSL
ncbi:heparin-sulfate lyase HepC [Mariniflexile ostreae]|uniref:Heparin-sulfate lyase HepC n=1 Tax=Mariniflexile ostreae TaxID=1520892 RepID=A0ABV5FBQ4_9FLAO